MIIILIIAFVRSFYLSGNFPAGTPTSTPTPNPIVFDYRLDVSPANGTILQGNIVNASVTITYVQGAPENITLSALGVPDGADYIFSQLQGLSTNNSAFNSILTIHASEAVATNSYPIMVTATADNGKTYSSPYTLSVLNSKISVSGTVSSGIGVVPTQMVFEQLSATLETTQTFTTTVQSGTYVIFLPNCQFYAVSVVWEKLDGSSGIQHYIQPIRFSAGVSITSIDCPFSWGP